MDSQNLVKSFKYNSSQHPIFSVIDSPLHYRSFPQNNPTAFRDVSFSSYIQHKDPPKNSQQNETGCTIDDTEISIFDAQKYFSDNNDSKDIKKQQVELLSVPRLSSVSSADGYGRNHQMRSFNATPTASSEASWNSQIGLLANPPGSMAVSLRNFPTDTLSKRKSPAANKWSFCRKCCCTGKNSVKVKEADSNSDINEMTKQSRGEKGPQKISNQQKVAAPSYPVRLLSPEKKLDPTNMPRQQRVSASGRPFGEPTASAFSFPILNSSIQATKPAAFKSIIANSVINPLEDPPRDSLEVFQPVHDPLPDLKNMDDDMYSDASSDLFEIESFSTQSNSYQMYRGRDSLDEDAPAFNPRRFAASANGLITCCSGNNNVNNLHERRSIDDPPTPSVAATECYAPSEVSIDWSVTTAEGFERASATNFSVSASEIGNVAFPGGDGGKRRGNGLLLMSCRQEKAVSVVKCAVPEGPPLFPLSISGGAAARVGGRPPRVSKLPLVSSHSTRVSLTFAAR